LKLELNTYFVKGTGRSYIPRKYDDEDLLPGNGSRKGSDKEVPPGNGYRKSRVTKRFNQEMDHERAE
jgi:hypothetical protein